MEEDFDQTIYWLTKMNKDCPENPRYIDSLYWLGMAKMFSKKYKEAQDDFEDLLSTAPTSQYTEDARYRVAVCLFGQNKMKEAREKLRGTDCIFLDQMSNDMNHLAHYEMTASEIISSVATVDAFVMGVGTAGTVTGVGRRLYEVYGHTLTAAVTPAGSALAGGSGRDHIEGLVSDFVPDLYNRYGKYVERVIEVSSREAVAGIAAILKATGLLVGPSTGAAFVAATKLIEEGKLDRNSTIVIVAADHLTRYPDIIPMVDTGSAEVEELLNKWQQ
jgi:cysteine synthase A